MPPVVYTLGEIAESELERIQLDNHPTGLPSGLDIERRVPGGIPRDKVTTIFAEAGNFKSTFKNHLLISMAEAGYRVLDVSLEDSKELTAHRYLARLSGVSYGAISGGTLTEDELGQLEVTPSARTIADNVVLVDQIEPTADTIFGLAYNQQVAAVAIDYVQLLAGPGSLKDRLDALMVKAQLFAKKQKIAVILVSQQKQATERDRDNPRPELGDMLGSSAMRIGSKLVIGLFAPSEYCPAPGSPKGPYGCYARFISANPENVDVYPEILEALILKNVLGRQGVGIHLRVNRATGLITNADELMRPYLG